MRKSLLLLSLGGIFFTSALSANYYCATCQNAGQNANRGYSDNSGYGYNRSHSDDRGYRGGSYDRDDRGYGDQDHRGGGYYGDDRGSYGGGRGNYGSVNDRDYDRNYSSYSNDRSTGTNWNDRDSDRGSYGGDRGSYYDRNDDRGSMNDSSSGMQDRQEGDYDGNRGNKMDKGQKDSSNMHEPRGPQTSFNLSDRRAHLADHELMGRIEETLGSYGYINVIIDRGNITLLGTVPSEEDKLAIRNRLRNLGLNARIDDRLQIADMSSDTKSSGHGHVSDQDIQAKIMDYTKSGVFSKGYPNVSYQVHNGHVVLNGTVDSESNRKDLIKKVQDIDGVIDVQSNLKVQPS
jgi:osmotically-inducible protein OsmY